MNTKIDINVVHELDNDTTIEATGKLDLYTGEVSELSYAKAQKKAPQDRDDYSLSYGVLKLNGKELEFALEVEGNTIQVPETDFPEMKEKAVALISSAPAKKKKP